MVFRRLINGRSIYLMRNYCKATKKNETTNIPEKDKFSREGDSGSSTTLSGNKLPKDHEIFHAIGATEELLSFLGLAREHAQECEHEYSDKLKRIQTIIIDISTAISKCGDKNCNNTLPPLHTKELEDWIREYSKELPPPEQYIIPGGGVTSATLHVTRSICRRTERILTPLVRNGELDREALVYLNRLADFLFTVSRLAAKLDKRTEIIYIPKPDQKIQAQ